MREWEYKWSLVSLEKVREKVEGKTVVRLILEGADKVAELGQQGWELVSVQPFQSTFTGESWAGGPGGSEVYSYTLFFKRPKGPERSADSP
jgi:hypothetical protein